MATLWFSPPVSIRASYGRHNVSNVQAASEELMKWTVRGPRWQQAVQSCIDAFEGRVTPNKARKAFLAAAQEARMLLDH
jgi:hypothetical protein